MARHARGCTPASKTEKTTETQFSTIKKILVPIFSSKRSRGENLKFKIKAGNLPVPPTETEISSTLKKYSSLFFRQNVQGGNLKFKIKAGNLPVPKTERTTATEISTIEK